MTLTSTKVRFRIGLTLAIWLSALALPALAKQEYSEEGANACLDCHETETVMGILQTPHADASDPKSPAAQHQCQSCHGPSAKHMMFPMQVENIHFSKGSTSKPEVQNQSCLECHGEGERANWHASAHGYEKIVCSNCHNVHDSAKLLPRSADVAAGCMECHDDLMTGVEAADFSHTIGTDLNGKGELSCAGCHNPHGPLESTRCTDCHEQSPGELAKQTPRAQRFHEVAARKNTDCIRCHKAIAHPIAKPVLEAMQAEMESAVSD
jgi:predicted CXXCH cytochrome family protein